MSDNGLATFDWSMVDLTPGVCVRRGGLHLDKWFGEWATRVDLSIMDVASIEYCPLAQASGELWTVAPEQEKGRDWMVAHGFNWPRRDEMPDGGAPGAVRDMLDELNRMWRVQIGTRRLAACSGATR